MMRIILYTGKGGVGKTSISAATAIRNYTPFQLIFLSHYNWDYLTTR